jgi:uncharacterized membrane-anchored protein YhcB (DUF1043 family)
MWWFLAGLMVGLVVGAIAMRAMCNRAFARDLEDLNGRLKGLVGDMKEMNAR